MRMALNETNPLLPLVVDEDTEPTMQQFHASQGYPETGWKLLFLITLAIAVPNACASVTLAQGEAVDRPPIRGWAKSAAISAPDAIQAAAADRSYFYAISNTRVAKYDRQTGKRVAISHGEAKHLNSGFFWKDKLYCAHSNYPKTPERSEIKVLNVEEMQLSTFKDFGNYGGSLTWAVRRDDHWWCNFAYYGEANQRTFLAKFDDDWQEIARWTYPPEVIGKLGRYSLSGGLWESDHLLVTGHDDPVVFRLRVPKNGHKLVYVDQWPAPFSGQGIAHDPITDGLVGINRARREIVLATRESQQTP